MTKQYFKDTHTIEVMVSTALQGKAPTAWGKAEWGRFHKTFKRKTITPYQLAGAIWKGYSFTPTHHGRRQEHLFDAAWHAAFDFDSEGAGLDYLMRPNSFAWTFASFAYATPSSTDDTPKSRVVFIFDEPIRSAQRARELYQAIAWRFNEDGSITDDQCKDPLRLYFGSPQCEMVGNWSAISTQSINDNPSAVDTLISQYNLAHPPIVKTTPQKKTIIDDDHVRIRVDRMLDNLRLAPSGERNYWRNKLGYTIGGVVAAGQMSEPDALAMLEDAALMSTDTPGKAKKEIKKSFENGKAEPLTLEIDQPIDIMDLIL